MGPLPSEIIVGAIVRNGACSVQSTDQETEGQINKNTLPLHYLLHRHETYPRDEGLSKATGARKSVLSKHLRALHGRSILATKDKGKTKIYFIDTSLKRGVEDMV